MAKLLRVRATTTAAFVFAAIIANAPSGDANAPRRRPPSCSASRRSAGSRLVASPHASYGTTEASSTPAAGPRKQAEDALRVYTASPEAHARRGW